MKLIRQSDTFGMKFKSRLLAFIVLGLLGTFAYLFFNFSNYQSLSKQQSQPVLKDLKYVKKKIPKRNIASSPDGISFEQNGQVYQEVRGTFVNKGTGKLKHQSQMGLQQKIGQNPYQRQVIKNLRTGTEGYLSGDVVLNFKSAGALKYFKAPSGFSTLKKLNSKSVLLRYFDPQSILTAHSVFSNHPDIESINLHVVEQEIIPK